MSVRFVLRRRDLLPATYTSTPRTSIREPLAALLRDNFVIGKSPGFPEVLANFLELPA